MAADRERSRRSPGSRTREFLANAESVAVVGYTKCQVRAMIKIYGTEFVHLVTIKDGKVQKFREFFDTFAAAEAFRALTVPW
jgi:uncharacterized protein